MSPPSDDPNTKPSRPQDPEPEGSGGEVPRPPNVLAAAAAAALVGAAAGGAVGGVVGALIGTVVGK